MNIREEKELLVKGCIIGYLVGDAIGIYYRLGGKATPLDMHAGPSIGKTDRPREAGTYSNSAALSLCTMATLIEFNSLDLDDLIERFQDCCLGNYMNWQPDDEDDREMIGYFTGPTTTGALKSHSSGMPVDRCGLIDEFAADSEAVMRMMPLGLWLIKEDLPKFISQVHRCSAMTHNNLDSQVCSALYALVVRNILLDKSEGVISMLEQFYEEHGNEDYKNAFQRVRQKAGQADSAVDAFWKSWEAYTSNQNNYKNAMVRCVRNGGSVNNICAITGSLIGLTHGVNEIPAHWLRGLKLTPEVMETVEVFTKKVVNRLLESV